MSTIAREVRVLGHVQGVYYRASTREQARLLAVAGEVRNLSDGGVQAWLEGEEEAVTALLKWMRQGPRRARVEELIVNQRAPRGFTDFEVIQ
ncbi:acylphosphatase [Alloalcanivorax mobilis]|uniref:acylphosphatase n=1 Tax=Alloalcanivorax mobilis TaxID=2019569 RepID=UPI000B5B22B8|nr:acylphosphatase [Alloalcanivorax mobilis]ASK33736.1 acylphosphatase [Alcanivorax sp. N3-2A]|tara:strand:- start:5008 stop:5283 length:276 start_codon:yes stop_codon:yes gene_type:complete